MHNFSWYYFLNKRVLCKLMSTVRILSFRRSWGRRQFKAMKGYWWYPKSHSPYEQSLPQSNSIELFWQKRELQRMGSVLAVFCGIMNAYILFIQRFELEKHIHNCRHRWTTAAVGKFSVLSFQVLSCHVLTENSPRLKSWVEAWLGVCGKIGKEKWRVRTRVPHLSPGGRCPRSWERALEDQSSDCSWKVLEFGEPVGYTANAP